MYSDRERTGNNYRTLQYLNRMLKIKSVYADSRYGSATSNSNTGRTFDELPSAAAGRGAMCAATGALLAPTAGARSNPIRDTSRADTGTARSSAKLCR